MGSKHKSGRKRVRRKTTARAGVRKTPAVVKKARKTPAKKRSTVAKTARKKISPARVRARPSGHKNKAAARSPQKRSPQKRVTSKRKANAKKTLLQQMLAPSASQKTTRSKTTVKSGKKAGRSQVKATSRAKQQVKKLPTKPQQPTAKRRTTAQIRKARSKKSVRGSYFLSLLRVLGRFGFRVAQFCFIFGALLVVTLFYYSRDLPSLDVIEGRTAPPRILVVDRHGAVISRYGEYHGKPIALAPLPDHVKHAFLATEDRNFYFHKGINPVAILRAGAVNVASGDVRQGGSTITQQLAKNLFLSPDRTLKRKVQEMLVAFWLEAKYNKDEIFALYLNNVYFGAGAYGLQAAADRYFGKHPVELSVGEAAMLAGLLKAPSRYAPSSNITAARERATIVVGAMQAAGYITQEQATAVLEDKIADVVKRDSFAGHAVDYAIAEMHALLRIENNSVIIRTTLDLEAQKKTEALLVQLADTEKNLTPDIEIAALSMETDGAIRVMIGGRDHARSEYNRATQAMRQPGSAFKPLVYLAALEQGRRPEDIIVDMPIEVGEWSPKNYKEKYYGAVSMTEAMSRSLNAAVIRLQEEVGRSRVVNTARRVGYPGSIKPDPAIALGVHELTPLALAGVYGTFANEGFGTRPYIISDIVTEAGEILYLHDPVAVKRAVKPEALIALNYMLREVVANGSGRAARLGRGHQAAGKTGTTQDSRDAWFAGHASGMVGVVWMGKDNNAPMTVGTTYISGSGAPARFWQQLMMISLADRPAESVVPYQPKSFVTAIINPLTALFSKKKSTPTYSAIDPIDDILQDVLEESEVILEQNFETTGRE